MAEIRSDGTKELIRTWASIASGPYVPLRADVSPSAIKRLLPRVFIISNEDGIWKFRLAGTEFYSLYGRELTGLSFSAIWGTGYGLVERGIEHAASVCLPLIITSEAWSLEGVVGGETVVLPLRSSGGHAEVDRFIGLQSFPGIRPWWLASKPFLQTTVGVVEVVGEKARSVAAAERAKGIPALRLVERQAKFRVLERVSR
ncbi:PAS domain-containing protein [Sinorhizobium meliloti]|nr:PAS domain-containing protein [Sinorhizobium meliloti]